MTPFVGLWGRILPQTTPCQQGNSAIFGHFIGACALAASLRHHCLGGDYDICMKFGRAPWFLIPKCANLAGCFGKFLFGVFNTPE
jgi:hypothetical protein